MEHHLSNRQRTRQSGYALILMVVVLMGIGGVMIAGFTQGAKQDAEHQRYLHNQRILREAKQALLQYAYNYPQMGPDQNDGPGRLPCPDTDNDNAGQENYVPNCGGNIVGRFPWGDADLNFYDARDASGERLWYAVSPNFGRGPGSEINSASFGGITVEDRSGAILHDGAATIPAGGVVAVIIAPGAPIARNGTVQVRGTDDEKEDKVNYLDQFGTRDNAVFVNGDANGFVTGPILDVVSGDLLVNDQMIVITAAEVIAMAEKATLQAYREAINDYLTNTGGVYPWLYNYDGIEYDYDPDPDEGESVDVAIDKLSKYFPVGSCDDSLTYPPDPPLWHTEADCVANGGTWDAGFDSELEDYLGRDIAGSDNGVFGRIPSTFADYFVEGGSEPIDTELSGLVGVTVPQVVSCAGCDNQFTLNNNQYQFNDFAAIKKPVFEVSNVLTNVRFVNLAGAGLGQLTGESATPVSGTLKMYFWDYDHGETTVYTPCADDGDGIPEFTDCNRNSADNPDPGGPNRQDLAILRINVPMNFTYDAVADEFKVDMNYTTAPAITISPTTADSHARISAAFAASSITPGTLPTMSAVATWDFAEHYHDGDTTISWNESGTLDSSGFVIEGPLTLGIRYYPVIPAWALQNDWHNSIRMAYAHEYEPPGTGPCIIDNTCLHMEDSAGTPQNVISLLVIAGQHNWEDLDANGSLKNDLDTVFDADNEINNPTFYRHRGNDKILVIDEL